MLHTALYRAFVWSWLAHGAIYKSEMFNISQWPRPTVLPSFIRNSNSFYQGLLLNRLAGSARSMVGNTNLETHRFNSGQIFILKLIITQFRGLGYFPLNSYVKKTLWRRLRTRTRTCWATSCWWPGRWPGSRASPTAIVSSSTTGWRGPSPSTTFTSTSSGGVR